LAVRPSPVHGYLDGVQQPQQLSEWQVLSATCDGRRGRQTSIKSQHNLRVDNQFTPAHIINVCPPISGHRLAVPFANTITTLKPTLTNPKILC